MVEAGPLVASGRDGDIFEYGPGMVLRRTKDGRVIEQEARIMEFAAANGYPVPHIHEVRAGGTEIVMERIDGAMMMDVIAKRPHRLTHYAHMLADLHDQLHAIPAPEWLRDLDGSGDKLLHLDLHPLNVMLTERGPVVIDWTNASRGDPLIDVGLTYVLLTCPQIPAPLVVRTFLQPFRFALARAFVQRHRGAALDERIAFGAELKMLDPNMLPDEVEKCRKLALRRRRAH